MTNPITINGLPTVTSAAAGDFVAIWRASNGDTRKITKANFMGATFTGGGSIATGGFTLTLPATGAAALKTGTPTAGRVASWSDANTVQDAGFAASDVARLATAQTFTALKTFSAGINATGADVTELDATAPDVNTPAVVARGVASQVAPVLEVRDSGGTSRFAVSASGVASPVNGLGWGQYEAFRRRSGVVSVSTSAVTILVLSTRMALVHVYGRSGTVYFSDLVMFMSSGGTAQATSIGAVTFGSAPTRSYGVSSNDLTLSLSSGTYNVQAVCISLIADP